MYLMVQEVPKGLIGIYRSKRYLEVKKVSKGPKCT